MRRALKVIVLVAGLFVAGSASADMEGNVQFLVGQRYMDDFWKPLDRQPMFGVAVDFAPKGSPVHVALSISGSDEKQTVVTPFFGHTNAEAGVFELSAGFVWLPVKKAIARPYLGAGVVTLGAAVNGGWDFFSATDTDHSFGFYGNAGIFFKVGDTFNIGIDGRIVRGTKVQFGTQTGNADYTQASLLLGFSFGNPAAP
jgi:hypothetical protein